MRFGFIDKQTNFKPKIFDVDKFSLRNQTFLSYSDKFESCKNIGDLFELVKETTYASIGLRRAGLTLYLIDLPTHIGGYHQIGSNAIVMNRTLLRAIIGNITDKNDINAYIYLVLLHEYLHALGYTDEERVTDLVHKISMKCFGNDHEITNLSKSGFRDIFQKMQFIPRDTNLGMDIVKDFDRSSMSYIG